MSRTHQIADIAIFACIGVILNLASFPPLGSLGRISLVYAYCYMSGVILGGKNGMIAVMFADILGYLLNNMGGVFVFQITLTNGFMALFAGLAYKHLKFKRKELRIIPAVAISFIVLTLGLSAWGEAMFLFGTYPYTVAKSIGASLGTDNAYIMIACAKAIQQPLWIIINTVIAILLLHRLRPFFDPESSSQDAIAE